MLQFDSTNKRQLFECVKPERMRAYSGINSSTVVVANVWLFKYIMYFTLCGAKRLKYTKPSECPINSFLQLRVMNGGHKLQVPSCMSETKALQELAFI